MEVVHGLDNLPESFKCGAIAIGFFDGVHWGHRAIFNQLLEVAHASQTNAIAFTFDRHPAELLAPEFAPPYITTLSQRIELINDVGVERILIADFDPGLAGLTPSDFLGCIVVGRLAAKHIVVGSNFRFGRDREGDVRYLKAAASTFGFELTVVPSVIIDGAPVSSTRIRLMISRGDVEEASRLLGRRFVLRGTVVPGDRVGRVLGFPTANIQTEPRQLLPAHGVYTVQTQIGGAVWNGLCYIGKRPTFRSQREVVEVHLMGYSGDLYGRVLDITFLRRLRGEMVFETPEKLAQQIRSDLERAAQELH